MWHKKEKERRKETERGWRRKDREKRAREVRKIEMERKYREDGEGKIEKWREEGNESMNIHDGGTDENDLK